jgi:hypothetical protein
MIKGVMTSEPPSAAAPIFHAFSRSRERGKRKRIAPMV